MIKRGLNSILRDFTKTLNRLEKLMEANDAEAVKKMQKAALLEGQAKDLQVETSQAQDVADILGNVLGED